MIERMENKTAKFDALLSSLNAKKLTGLELENTEKDPLLFKNQIAELLEECPFLKGSSDFLYFINTYGGMYIETKQVSIGLYGFKNSFVPDILEKPMLDPNGLFIVGDVLNLNNEEDHLALGFKSLFKDGKIYGKNINSEAIEKTWSDFYSCLSFFIQSLD